MARFDVLLPVRNGGPYFVEAVDSIRAQSLRDWRLIVLDHGSTDGSLDLAHRYAESDFRIKVMSCPEAAGLSDLLNRGLHACDCDYVLRQDADDVSVPLRMAVLEQAFVRNPGLIVAGSQAEVIDASGRRIGRMDMPRGEHGMAAAALFRTPAAHPAVAMRLKALRRLGARYGEDFLGFVPPGQRLRVPGLAEDYFLFGQLAFSGPCVNLDEELVRYRWHAANVAATKFLDQMRIALEISRYLARSLAIRHGLDTADPAPFCNHGEQLLDVGGGRDFSDEWRRLRALLRKAVAESADLRRELAFRGATARRGRAGMLSRYAAFAARFGVRQTEYRTVRAWLTRGLRRRNALVLTSSGLSA